MAQQAKGAYEASWFLPSIWLLPSCGSSATPSRYSFHTSAWMDKPFSHFAC